MQGDEDPERRTSARWKGECAGAQDQSQDEALGYLDARHAPVLPQHRDDGRPEVHAASACARGRPARARKISSSVASRDSTISPPRAATAWRNCSSDPLCTTLQLRPPPSISNAVASTGGSSKCSEKRT